MGLDIPAGVTLTLEAEGTVTITTGSRETVTGVAPEGVPLLVAFGHDASSADGADVGYFIDDDNATGMQDLVFDEGAGGGDAVIFYQVFSTA